MRSNEILAPEKGGETSPMWAALLDIARQVAARPGDEGMLHEIVAVARDMLSADFALITTLDADGEHACLTAQVGLPNHPPAPSSARFNISRYPLARRTYENGDMIVVDDVANHPESRYYSPVLKLASRAFYVAPITVPEVSTETGNVIGTLSVHFKDVPHEWTEEEQEWLSALTGQAAVALMMSHKTVDNRRDSTALEALYTASQRLQSAADLNTVIDATMEGVMQVVPCVGVTVHLLNEQATEATMAGLRGFKDMPGKESALLGFKYPADDSVLNSRTLLDHESFYLGDFQVEAGRWQNPNAPTLRAWMSVPLMSQGRCLGKITVDHDLPDVYGPEEMAIVQTFAAHAAVAIERAYLYADANSRADHLLAIYQISQQAVAAKDEPSLYEILYRGAMQAFNADVFFICLAKSENDKFEFPMLMDNGEDFGPIVVEPSPGPASEVLRTGKATVIKGEAEWEHLGRRRIGNTAQPAQAAIFAPLAWGGVTLGVMSVQTYQDRAYTKEEFQTFQALAATAALAMGRIRSEQALGERAAQFAALAESASALVSKLQLSDVLQTVVDRANELTGGEAFLMMHKPDEDKLNVRSFAGSSAWHRQLVETATLRPNEGIGGVAFAEQRTIVVDDMRNDPRAMYQGESPMRSLLVMPLTVGSSRMGILELAWPEPGAVTPERLALCMAFADHAALAIHNARQHEQLRQREAERTALLRQLLTAQEAERKRVSIDLHDGPLQSLGVGLINADTLRKRVERGTIAASDVEQLRLDFAAVVDEIRGLIADLRPEVLDSYGLMPALEAHARRIMETTDLDITIECDLPERLPAYMEVLIYRLVQESLSNVRKHAHATNASVNISLDVPGVAGNPEAGGIVNVSVMDNGRGFDPRQLPARPGGFGVGLSSMAERTEGAGGTMSLSSAPGGPTTLNFQLPVPRTED